MIGPILVTGGTGNLGRPLVECLTQQGIGVRVLSRRPAPGEQKAAGQQTAGRGLARWANGDLKTGRGIEAAVEGAEVIVHCATGRGDAAAARNLIEAAKRAGSPHLVYISIVGIDRIPFGYYKSKLDVELQIGSSGLPWTVLRATQFHELMLRVFEAMARLPVMLLPAATSFQPVAAAEVAALLAELAIGPPAGRVPDMGGPEVRGIDELARMYLEASGRRRPVLPLRLPGGAFAAFRAGRHLAPDHAAGRITFGQFLAGRLGGASGQDGGTAPGSAVGGQGSVPGTPGTQGKAPGRG